MKSLLIINGQEYEVEFLKLTVSHREFEDYETVVTMDIEHSASEEKVEAVGVLKPKRTGIQEPEDVVVDLKSAGIDEKLLEELRAENSVKVFRDGKVPEDKVVSGTVWKVETRRYDVEGTDPIGSAIRDLVLKERNIKESSKDITALLIEKEPAVKLVGNGFHIMETVKQLKDRADVPADK